MGLLSGIGDAIGGVTGSVGDIFGGALGAVGNVIGGPLAGYTNQPQMMTVPPKPGNFQALGLLDQHMRLPTGLTLNPTQANSAVHRLKQAAFSNQSPWATMSLRGMNANKQQLADRLYRSNLSDAQVAMSEQSAKSGMDAASAAMIADRTRNQNMLDQQNLRRQERMLDLDRQKTDAQMRADFMGGAFEGDLNLAKAQQFNMSNRLKEKRRLDALDKIRYQTEMGDFAAGQSGQAIADAGSGGLLGNLFGGLFG